jgi:beta-mannosidase
MYKVVLTEEQWEAGQYDSNLPDHQLPDGSGRWFVAAVPGAIQYDLVALGKLENPYASTKAAFDAAWVAKSDWLYRKVFETPAKASEAETILLRFKGVDTYAEVWLNGTLIGETANAYRSYDFPVKPGILAADGKNTLLVRVKAHERVIASKIDETEKHLNNGRSAEGTLGKSLIRRYQRSFFGGSSLLNLGTGILGIGIVREVSLVLYTGAYLSDCCFKTLAISEEQASCKLLLSVKNSGENTKLKIRIRPPAREAEGGQGKADTGGDNTVFTAEIPFASPDMEIPVTIEKPELWWPRGYGEPGLYTLTVTIEQNGRVTDEAEQQIGIKTSQLVTRDERGRKTFYFKINGRKVFVHGENIIPLDYIKSYGSREEYRRVFDMLDNQYVNMVRIWGGGVIEDDYFYGECDRRGIMLYQDFFLHSNQYPDYDLDWTEEFLRESEEMLKQIRPHPCLCLICGGNETREGWDCWGWRQATSRFNGERLITQDLPAISAKLCAELPYIDNSPHGGMFCQSPAEGECHNWGNYYNSGKDPLFVTETCWTQESYSRPETLMKYMGLDADEFTGLNWAGKWKERTSLDLFTKRPYSDWFETENLKLYLRSLEVEQMRADYSALSMFRFASPGNNGFLYWSFNKGGPLFQFGCVDYGGYPMMPYYAVKKAFAPLAVQARRDVSDISVMVSNHGTESVTADIEVFHLMRDGARPGYWREKITIEPEGLIEAFRLEGLYREVNERTTEVIYVCVTVNGKLISDDMLFFCSFIEYAGEYRALGVKTEKTPEGRWLVRLEAETPVRMVELESSQKLLYSDNYFPLIPEKPKTVEAVLLEKTSDGPVYLTAGIFGTDETRTFTLD